MRRSSLPNVKDNLVISRSNVRYPHSPNVSRSWSPREVRGRAEERLAKSVGDRGQERKVLEWCKKNNVNVIRKLPKLDSAILTSKGMNTENFMTFVDEAKMVEREQPTKPPDFSKIRTSSAKHRENFCEFCQRELPKKKRRGRGSSFTSPYQCGHCGASNDLDDVRDHAVSSSDSEDDPSLLERVQDTIRRRNPAQVIDHRAFSESEEKSENFSQKVVDTENDSEFDSYQGDGDFEEKLADMNLSDVNEASYSNTVFLTESTLDNHDDRPVEVKMAWDDESSNHFAEMSRTIATNDGIEEDDVISQESNSGTSENCSEKFGNSKNLETSNLGLFPGSNPVGRLSPTPPSQNRPASSLVSRNLRYGEHHRRRSSGLEMTNADEASPVEPGDMTQSPIANRSVGLSRVALMRLTRQSRARSRGSRSSPGTPVARLQEPRSHSHDPQDSYSFLDAVSPEIKSIHEQQDRPDSSES